MTFVIATASDRATLEPDAELGGECEDRSWLSGFTSQDVPFELPGGEVRTVSWGQPWEYESPAYWVAMTQDWWSSRREESYSHRLGGSMAEEIVACLLGGYGIAFEVNVAAFVAVRDAGLIRTTPSPSANELERELLRPVRVGNRDARYRFPRQRSSRIASALERLSTHEPPRLPDDAREWLLEFDGIGPKTASWIVRNQYPDSNVAIIDIHVHRAGVQAGVFDSSWLPSRDYSKMEAAFLEWARIGGVAAAHLDAVIWRLMAERARTRRQRALST